MTKLYELTKSINELASMEEDQAVIDTLEGLEMEFEDKAKNIILLERNINSDITALDDEIKRLQQRKKMMQNRIDSMKDYLRDNMERSGINKIECPLFTIICAKGRDIADIESVELLPDDCVELKTEVKPNKALIVKKLKSGEEVPGAKLVKSKSAITIK